MFNGRAGVPLSSSCSDSYGNGDVLNEIENFLGSSSSREPRVNSGADIPPVDISTFCSVLGTKFFCFDPCDFGYVTEEIVSYLTAPNTDVNFDHDDAVHAWKCYENVEFESSVFTIALFEDCDKEKIYVKFHRLSGSCSIFSNSVDRFARLACVACDLNQVDPIDRSEKRVTIESVDEAGKKKRKGAFKAMPLPLSLKRRAVTCPEFLAYCEIFNVWAHSDIPECLTSMLTSMPKVWKDLLDHHETVSGVPSAEAMGELVTMFASVNKIYKNLCAIAVQSHNSMLSVEHSVPVSGLEALSLENAAAHPAVIITDTTTQSHDPTSYDYLDYDEVDGSAGYADDHMFGAHAAAGNFAHRTSVTLDVTKSHHRSMAVFEDSSARFTAVRADSAAKAPLAAAAPTFEVQLSAKKADSSVVEAKYAKFMQPAAASPCGAATAEVCQFATLLTNKSREELSSILYLALACICDQFSTLGATEAFNQQHYLTHLLKSNTEFISVLQEIAQEQSDPRIPANSFGSFRSKDIKLYASQLSSLL